jgi:hypothetical protein
MLRINRSNTTSIVHIIAVATSTPGPLCSRISILSICVAGIWNPANAMTARGMKEQRTVTDATMGATVVALS